ncbi:MAG: thioredoxin family protein [Ignavibacteria bacterium]|nr:thioredoxin family protein [Ignavibacteria bacterium]
MLQKSVYISLMFIFTLVLSAQTSKPESAEVIVKSAVHQAKVENKSVMVIFHASWCKWCKRLEKAFDSPELHKIISDNFVITYVDVLERQGKIDSLENPGGRELMKKWAGEKAGLPFCVFLSKTGMKITDSNQMPDKSNIGYPGSKDEIQLFVAMLKKASKKLSVVQAAAITDYLIQNAPKQ